LQTILPVLNMTICVSSSSLVQPRHSHSTVISRLYARTQGWGLVGASAFSSGSDSCAAWGGRLTTRNSHHLAAMRVSPHPSA
jgi:hypothetical protein